MGKVIQLDDLVYHYLSEVDDLHDCIVNDFSRMTLAEIEKAVLTDVSKASGLMRAVRVNLLESALPDGFIVGAHQAE